MGAGDAERVFELLRTGLVSGFFSGRGDLVRSWLADLELDSLPIAPDLMLEYALASARGEWDELEVWLDRLERSWPEPSSPRFKARRHVVQALRAAERGEMVDTLRSLDAATVANETVRDDAVASIDLVRVRVATWCDDFDGSRRA